MLSRMGESMGLTVGAIYSPIQAVYLGRWTGQTEFGLQVERKEPEIRLRTSDFSALGAKEGDLFTRSDGTQYLIVDCAAHDGDWTICRVRASA